MLSIIRCLIVQLRSGSLALDALSPLNQLLPSLTTTTLFRFYLSLPIPKYLEESSNCWQNGAIKWKDSVHCLYIIKLEQQYYSMHSARQYDILTENLFIAMTSWVHPASNCYRWGEG